MKDYFVEEGVAKKEANSATFTNASMAEQLQGFKVKPQKRMAKPAAKKPASTDLSGLTLRVEVGDDAVDVEELRRQAKERSETLFSSADKYYEMCREIDQLRSIDKIELTDRAGRLESLLTEKDRFDAYLAKKPQGVQDQFKTDLFIVEIDKAMPTKDGDVIAVFRRIEEMGRGRKLSAEEISKTPQDQRLYFFTDKGEKHNLGHVLSQMPGREGQVSGADKRIFKSARQMIWRYSECRRKNEREALPAEIAKCEKICQETGEDPRNFLRKVPGVYVFYLPGKKVNDKPVGMPGAAKVKIYTFNKGQGKEAETKIGLKILESAGCLKPRWEAHEKFGFVLPFWWLERYIESRQEKKGNVEEESLLPDSVPEVMRPAVMSFVKKLYAAYIRAKKRTCKEAGSASGEAATSSEHEETVLAKELAEFVETGA